MLAAFRWSSVPIGTVRGTNEKDHGEAKGTVKIAGNLRGIFVDRVPAIPMGIGERSRKNEPRVMARLSRRLQGELDDGH